MRTICPFCLIVALLSLSGCGGDGPERAEVRGRVLLDGEPIQEGIINFEPTEGTQGPGTGGSIKEGSYHLPRHQGPVIGKNRVVLRAFRQSKQKIQDPTAPPGTLVYARVQVFPPEYSDKSTIVKVIQHGSNELDFDVQTKGRRP